MNTDLVDTLYNTSSLQQLVCTKLENESHFLVFEACYLPRDACYSCQFFGSYKISSVTLGQLTYSKLTTHNLTEFAAPNRLVYLALLAEPQNLNLTFHNYNTISISAVSILLIVRGIPYGRI